MKGHGVTSTINFISLQLFFQRLKLLQQSFRGKMGQNYFYNNRTPLILLSVMIAGLEEIDTAVADDIHYAVFLGKTPGPRTRMQIFQWLRLSNAGKRVAHNCFYKIKCPDSDTAINPHPVF
jgi:hypothetical protein